MKILFLEDEDGHSYAFDASTPEKEKKLIFSLLTEWMEKGDANGCKMKDVAVELKVAIEAGDLKKVYDLWEICFDIKHEGTRGGRIQLLEVKTEWEPGFGRRI